PACSPAAWRGRRTRRRRSTRRGRGGVSSWFLLGDVGDRREQRFADRFETGPGLDLGAVELALVEHVGDLRAFGVDLRERDAETELVHLAREAVEEAGPVLREDLDD